MIKRSFDELKRLPKSGVLAQKIRALALGYGYEYDFCGFYSSENAVFAKLNGDFVLCELGECDYDELSEFFGFCGFSKILCSERAGNYLGKSLDIKPRKLNLMSFHQNSRRALPIEAAAAAPTEAFEIIGRAFDIEFEPWYLDMSHMTRHGISRLYTLDGSALAVQYSLNGEALLSQIATLPEKRGQGRARRLIASVCGKLEPCEVFVLCEDALTRFYSKCGFTPCGVYSQIEK